MVVCKYFTTSSDNTKFPGFLRDITELSVLLSPRVPAVVVVSNDVVVGGGKVLGDFTPFLTGLPSLRYIHIASVNSFPPPVNY